MLGKGLTLDIVYHWSPSSNRKSILTNGLQLFQKSFEYVNPVTKKDEVWLTPYICTGTTPWVALCYCIPTFDGEIPPLDLYQIILSDMDAVVFRNDKSREIIEVRIQNTIPPDRINYIASRESE